MNDIKKLAVTVRGVVDIKTREGGNIEAGKKINMIVFVKSPDLPEVEKSVRARLNDEFKDKGYGKVNVDAMKIIFEKTDHLDSRLFMLKRYRSWIFLFEVQVFDSRGNKVQESEKEVTVDEYDIPGAHAAAARKLRKLIDKSFGNKLKVVCSVKGVTVQ